LRPPIASRDRLVRLQLLGLSGADYRLHAECESGRSAVQSGRADGCHELQLPPGPCVVIVAAGPSGSPRRFERVFTVSADPEQDVVFDLIPPR
jgi:hypothetical protein